MKQTCSLAYWTDCKSHLFTFTLVWLSQDSMLEFDGQALDPAIVSAQPMKPVQAVDLQQMGGALRE